MQSIQELQIPRPVDLMQMKMIHVVPAYVDWVNYSFSLKNDAFFAACSIYFKWAHSN